MASPDMAAASPRAYHSPPPTTSSGGVPCNPFSRTLASIESQDRGAADDRTPAEKTALGNNRVSLDVESFKNLLMTGKPGPRQSGQYPTPASATQFESSSGTDTSSISRNSFFEPPQETRVETTRDFDMADSDDEDRIGRVTDTKKAKKKPPPAPKHRYGKPVTPRQPQVVAFESFSATEPAPAPAPVTRSRDNSDVARPLPPTPVISQTPLHTSTIDTTNDSSVSADQRSTESSTSSEIVQPQKKAPPPVPLARRQSQLRSSTNSNRSRSNSSLTMSSQISIEAPLPSPVPSNKDPLSVTKSPPPPPRSRHGARLTDISTSSANSSTTELPQRSASIRTTASAQDPISSRRSTLESDSASLHRTSSNRNSRIVSNESINSNMAPPPPPPPRRRQSNRSSLDQQRPTTISPSSPPSTSRRTSMENRRTSLENKRRTSVASESSLRREYALPEETEQKSSDNALYSPEIESADKFDSTPLANSTPPATTDDTAPTTTDAHHGPRSDSSNILDDMEKFQREIDELRLKFKQSG